MSPLGHLSQVCEKNLIWFTGNTHTHIYKKRKRVDLVSVFKFLILFKEEEAVSSCLLLNNKVVVELFMPFIYPIFNCEFP